MTGTKEKLLGMLEEHYAYLRTKASAIRCLMFITIYSLFDIENFYYFAPIPPQPAACAGQWFTPTRNPY